MRRTLRIYRRISLLAKLIPVNVYLASWVATIARMIPIHPVDWDMRIMKDMV